MQIDVRDDPFYKQSEAATRAWLRPGTGEIAALGQIAVSADARRAIGAATVCDALEGVPSTRLALCDLETGNVEIITHGPRSDSAPQWSPDSSSIAYLSDREQAHVNRLRIIDPDGNDRPTPAVAGFVEYFRWSPDGGTILIGVAGYGSELAGSQGAFAVHLTDGADARPSWMPAVEGTPEATPWRSLWLYDLASETTRRITSAGLNVWEAVWCGPCHIAAICSERPEETAWYAAEVCLIDLDGGAARTLFKPADQLGWLAATPSGRTIAVVEAVCSDRNIVAGDLRLIDVDSGTITRPETLGADIVQLHWRGEDQLLFVGVQGPEALVGLLDRKQAIATKLWRDGTRTPSGVKFPEVTPLGDNPSDFLFLCEGFFEAPVLLAFAGGQERVIRRFGTPETHASVERLGSARDFCWTAPDGLRIHGWLLTPPGPGPHPLIMQVHGGPVYCMRPAYVGRSAFIQMALARGYALFQPNPRGSSGRGQQFARHVFGDMGGADTQDYLSGLDALEAQGIVDRGRIGVTGGSYGGYISSWLITQDRRFAAAVPASPVNDWVSQQFTCNIPSFCEMFLNDSIDNPTGRYFTRSPIHFARHVETPTLHICGALDRITPPTQALEFHRALLGEGVESVLVTYPNEGHGVRNMPAMFDRDARMLSWFAKHMPPNGADDHATDR